MVCKFKQKIIYSRASSATFAGYDVEKILDETIDMEIITFGSPIFCNKEFSIFVYSRICEIWEESTPTPDTICPTFINS